MEFVAIKPEMDVEEQKTAFAMALLKNPDNPFQAALSILPDTPSAVGFALQIAQLWVNDKFVAEEKLRLIEELGSATFLPTKVDQCRDIWKMATNEKLDEEVRLKAHRLYAEIMGNIEKPTVNNNINNGIVNNGVMIVPVSTSMDEWEKAASAQQRELILNAS